MKPEAVVVELAPDPSAATVDEPVWQLPLEKGYRKLLDSNVADMKNVGGPYGGAILAALVLSPLIGFWVGFLFHRLLHVLLMAARPAANSGLRAAQFVTAAGLAWFGQQIVLADCDDERAHARADNDVDNGHAGKGDLCGDCASEYDDKGASFRAWGTVKSRFYFCNAKG